MNKLNITVNSGEKAKASDFNAVTGKVDEIVDAINNLPQGGGGGGVAGNEVKCSLSEYYALRDAGQIVSTTKYYIINIDCDFEATEL